MATLFPLETFKWEYSFGTPVLEIGLIAIRDESPLYSMCWVRPMFRVMTTSVPAISGHNQFGTYSLRDIPNSEHTHFGTCHIGTSIIRECGKSVQATIRLYFVTIHAIYNCLSRIATASERTASIIATS